VEGQTVSHYHVLERLGAGGMGVVYKAQDNKLKRTVALKFLPPELTRDEEARDRFIHEAQAASALDHANICTIYEFDATPDGRMFLSMAYYQGETLKERLNRGPMTLEEAIDVTLQVAQGLAKAHAAGIIHRDIKPANVMITTDGAVKILDFGLAKLSGASALTRTGAVPGTVSYMSPEQLNGDLVDQRADLWALGVVLYQMLTGQLPFRADHEAAVTHAILSREPEPLNRTQPQAPARLQQILDRALKKNPHSRYASAADFIKDLSDYRTTLTTPSVGATSSRRTLSSSRVAAGVLVGVVLLGAVATWAWMRGADARWARTVGIPEIKRLVSEDHSAEAFTLAERVDRVLPGNPELAELWLRISVLVSFDTTPPNAEIRVREHSVVDGPWKTLGRSPVKDVRLPLGAFRVQANAEGYQTVEVLERFASGAPTTRSYALRPKEAHPEMIAVPGGSLSVGFIHLSGSYPSVESRGFLMDRYEVTNEDFKKFVDRGGYEARVNWRQEFVKHGRKLSWEDAVAEFRDATNRPGPSTWSVGTFPDGQGRFPVMGVSWYEAVAYCDSVGKTLPTVYHWANAASIYWAQFIVPFSNYTGKGPSPVGSTHGISRYGASDMAGNAREWAWNARNDHRYLLGGGWNESAYSLWQPDSRDPFDRSPSNGFRCALHDGPVPEAMGVNMPVARRDYSAERPVSDEVFTAYKGFYSYDKKDLNAKVEPAGEKEHWRTEEITFDAAYEKQRTTAYLLLPKSATPPYQTIVYWPGQEVFGLKSSADFFPPAQAEFLLVSGRAVICPIYDGTFERNRGDLSSSYQRPGNLYRDYAKRQVQDLMRSIDYLETRGDIDKNKLAYFGFSWGGRMGGIVPAVEPRVKAAILLLAGLPMQQALPEVDAVNFAGRIRIPVLLMGGEFDFNFPVDASQVPLIKALGTSAGDKRHVILAGTGHDTLGRFNQVIRESLAWLDKYLGPVK
jgi:eukaryotic-like serine/threonine-protein kinase